VIENTFDAIFCKISLFVTEVKRDALVPSWLGQQDLWTVFDGNRWAPIPLMLAPMLPGFPQAADVCS
jgi:hypothetical protein